MPWVQRVARAACRRVERREAVRSACARCSFLVYYIHCMHKVPKNYRTLRVAVNVSPSLSLSPYTSSSSSEMAGGCAVWPSVVVVLVLCGGCVAVKPGFRTAITSKGLDYICQVGIPILEKELLAVSIPDISGKAGTPIGDVDYTLTSIKMTQFQIPSSSLSSASAGLVLKTSGILLHLTADWSYRESSWPHISDHGSCDVSVSSVSLQIDVKVGADSKGHATLSSSNCNFDIGSLDITFHGGASWLYNLFSGYIADKLKESIQGQVCSAAVSAIDTQGNAALESLPVMVPIDSTSEVDFALLQSPTFTTSYVETQHKGEFLDIAHPVEAPFAPPSLPPVLDTSRMLYVWLTDYIADTAGFVYLTAGLLTYNVTPNMIPPTNPFQLNTSSFRALIPQLYSKYPNWAMLLQLNATKPPLFTLSPSGGNLTAFGDVLVYVINPANQTDIQLAFVLGMIVYSDATVYVHASSGKEIISANATFLKVDITLIRTNIGPFTVSVLQNVANFLCTAFIIPAINHFANAGMPIPTADGVAFVNPSIVFGQDYVVVSTDITYTPSLVKGQDTSHYV